MVVRCGCAFVVSWQAELLRGGEWHSGSWLRSLAGCWLSPRVLVAPEAHAVMQQQHGMRCMGSGLFLEVQPVVGAQAWHGETASEESCTQF